MPHEILDSMRALREDMRQRLMQVPEYRALVSLDRTIDELCGILAGAGTQAASRDFAQTPAPAAMQMPTPMPAPMPTAMAAAPQPAPAPQAAASRAGGIATAFAETLAAKIDQRNLARAPGVYAPPTHRALGE